MVTGTASETDLIRAKGLEDEAALCGQQIALDARKAMRREIAERGGKSYLASGRTAFENYAERELFLRELMTAFNEEMAKDGGTLPEGRVGA